MDRQVKIDYPRLPVPFTYTGNSKYQHRQLLVRKVGPRGTGEPDCRGLGEILCGGELAGGKTHRLYCTYFCFSLTETRL